LRSSAPLRKSFSRRQPLCIPITRPSRGALVNRSLSERAVVTPVPAVRGPAVVLGAQWLQEKRYTPFLRYGTDFAVAESDRASRVAAQRGRDAVS
jgi:hypothetical protein